MVFILFVLIKLDIDKYGKISQEVDVYTLSKIVISLSFLIIEK